MKIRKVPPGWPKALEPVEDHRKTFR